MPEQHRHLANKYEDNVNLQGAEAYHGGRPPTACYMHTTVLYLQSQVNWKSAENVYLKAVKYYIVGY